MHKIEPAPTGRASCRGCKSPIAKDALRFAEEYPNPYADQGGPSYRYWHLACAATKLANEVGAALAAYDGPIDDRASIEALVREHARPEMPYAERASNGRARCRACDEPIPKGALRVAFERLYDTPMGPQKTAAYVHPRCVSPYLEHAEERERERAVEARAPREGESEGEGGGAGSGGDGHGEGGQGPSRDEVVRRILANSKLSPADLDAVRDELGR